MTHKDPERARLYKQQYYQRHKEQFRNYSRQYHQRHKEQISDYNRDYGERLKRGEIQLPPLDWAICARGGSEAQARAHYRRGEKACPACARAAYNARKDRELRRKNQVAA